MTQTVTRWGHSLGIRIPKALAEQVHLEEGTVITLEVSNGNLIIKPKRKKYNLDELLEDMEPDNIHAEVDLGAPVGNEVW